MADLVIPGTRHVLAVAAAEKPEPEDLDGWDIGERIITSPARGWLIGRYLHTGLPPNSNGHVFRHDHIAKLHPTIVHTPFDMLHDPRRIVGHYAATKLVTPSADAAAGYTDTPYVKALACVYSYNFPDDFREIQDAYEQGLAFMSMSCRPQSVTCPTCGHNAPWLGYTHDAYCSHMQGRNPKWMEMPLFVGGAAIVPPTRPGWRNASVTRIAAFMDANEDLTAGIFERLHELAPSAAAADLEAMTAQLLAIAFGKDATDTERTVTVAPGAPQDADPDFSHSGMLALYPANGGDLVIEGGQPADEMHVTIAYLGKTDEVSAEAYEIAGSFGLAALAARPAIEASVSGVGTLGSEGAVVLFLQGPGLTDAYDETWAVLDGSGQSYHQRHPSFIAHCTLGYGETPEERVALIAAAQALVGTTVVLDRAGYDAPGADTPEFLPLLPSD